MAYNNEFRKKSPEEMEHERQEFDKKRSQYDAAVRQKEKCFLCDFEGLVNAVDDKRASTMFFAVANASRLLNCCPFRLSFLFGKARKVCRIGNLRYSPMHAIRSRTPIRSPKAAQSDEHLAFPCPGGCGQAWWGAKAQPS